MKNILTILTICLCSTYMMSQEKWGSYNGSIAGVTFNLVEACGDSVEVSTGNWYEKIQITFLNFTVEGAGRQVRGDSVFFKASLLDNSAPVLLYDYSVEVGDMVTGLWGDFIVTEVDTEFAVGEERKRITMESTYDGHLDVWLSGLGSKVAGYLQPGSPLNAPDAGSEFSCYLNESSGEFYYGDKDPSLCMIVPTGSACLTTAVDDEAFAERIKIYPNPSDGFIGIKIDNGIGERINVQLFSLDGKELVNRDEAVDGLSLDVSGFGAGVYLLELRQEGKVSRHKVVVQ